MRLDGTGRAAYGVTYCPGHAGPGRQMKRHFYYGAAIAVLLTQPALADTRDDVMAAMQRCAVLQDDRTWLECTYGAQQIMRAKLGLPPAPDYQQRLVPPASAVSAPMPETRKPVSSAPRRGSFWQVLTGSAPPVATSTLTAIDYDGQGAFIVTLQNGQVWRQVDVESGPKARPKIGSKVTITPGAFSSYNFKSDDDPHIFKVVRKS